MNDEQVSWDEQVDWDTTVQSGDSENVAWDNEPTIGWKDVVKEAVVGLSPTAQAMKAVNALRGKPLKPSKVTEAFSKGFTGQVSDELPKNVPEFLIEKVPESAGAMTSGLPQFINKVGETVYDVAKTATAPVVPLLKGEHKKALKAFKTQGLYTSQEVNQMAKGLEEFALLPSGIKPFPKEGEKYWTWEQTKKNYYTKPFETVFGAFMLAHGMKQAFGKEATPVIPVIEKTAKEGVSGEGFTSDIPMPENIKEQTQTNIDARINALKKGKKNKKLSKKEVENIVKKEVGETLTKADAETRQKLIDIEAANIQKVADIEASKRGILPRPIEERALSVEEATEKTTKDAVAEARLANIRELVKEDPTVKAEESAKVIDSIESRMQELDALVKNIKAVGKEIDYGVGERVGLQKVPTKPTPSPQAEAGFRIVQELNKINELKQTAEASTGMDLRTIYDPVIKEIINKLPNEIRIEVEKELVKQPIEPIVDISTGHEKPIAGGKFKDVLRGRFPKRKGKKPPIKEVINSTVQPLNTPLPEFPTVKDIPGIDKVISKLKEGDITALQDVAVLENQYGGKVYHVIGNNIISATEGFMKIKPQYDAMVMESMRKASEKATIEKAPLVGEIPIRPAQLRKLKEEAVAREKEGPTIEELDEIQRDDLTKEDARDLEKLDLLDDEFESKFIVEETGEMPKENVPIKDKGKNVMIRRYLRDRHGSLGNKMFDKLDVDAKNRIWNDIRRDQIMWEDYGGDTQYGPTIEMLGLQTLYEAGAKRLKEINFSSVSNRLKRLKDDLGIDALPRLSRFSNISVDKGVEHASVKAISKRVSKALLSNALPEHYKNPTALSKFKDILNKDNVLHGYEVAIKTAEKLSKSKPTEAIKWYEAAKDINKAHDIAAYEKEIRATLNDANFVDAMKRIKAEINPFMDKTFLEAKGLDPNTKLDGRGKYYGVRTNLVTKELGNQWKEFIEGEETIAPNFPASGNYRNPNVKHDPFDTAAKFTGEYSVDFEASLNAVLSKRLNEVTKARFYNQLIKSGVAKVIKPGESRPTSIKVMKDGKMQEFEVGNVPVKIPKTNEAGKTSMEETRLYVPRELTREIADVLDTQMRGPSGRILVFLNRIQLAQAVDAIFHTRNNILAVNKAMQSEAAWKGVQNRFPGFGAAKSISRIIQVMNEISTDSPPIRREMAKMSWQGSIRTEYPHYITPKFIRQFLKNTINKSDIGVLKELSDKVGEYNIGKMVFKIDAASRIILNRHYTDLVRRGLKEDTVASRREFNAAIGQYNRRLMGYFMRFARDTAIAPFIVAGRNYFVQGVRSITGKSGGKATSRTAELNLRFISATGVVISFAMPAMLNMITTGTPGGRSGTKAGEWDLGLPEDEKGKHRSIDLLQFTLIRRGARALGLNASIEGIYEGQDLNTILGNAMDESKRSLIHPWLGPGARFLIESAGMDVEEYKGKYAPLHIPEGGAAQYGERFRAAGEALNPPIYSLIRPTLVDLGIDKKPIEEEKDFWNTMLEAPKAVAGLRDRGSSAYYEMNRMYRNRGKKTAETPKQAAVRALRNGLEGEPDDVYVKVLKNALVSGIVDQKEANKIFDNRHLTALERGFKSLSVKGPMYEAIQVWNKMTAEEKLNNAVVLEKKINNAWDTVPVNEEAEFIKQVKPVLEEFKSLIKGEDFSAVKQITNDDAEYKRKLAMLGREESRKVTHTQTENTPPILTAQLLMGAGKLVKESFPLAFPSEAEKIAKLPANERYARAAGGALDVVIPLQVGFTTKIAKGLGQIKAGTKFNASTLWKMFKNKFQVRDEELKWLNIDELSKGKKSVSKEEIVEHVRENMPKINKIVKGQINYRGQNVTVQKPKFSKHKAVPGGMDYREVLYQLETPQVEEIENLIKASNNISTAMSNLYLPENYNRLSVNELSIKMRKLGEEEELIRKKLFDARQRKNKFTGEHWDEPDIISHARLDDRVDVTGKKGTLVQEIQSDWNSELKQEIPNVLDAPLLKNWYEFTMKNVIDDAVKKGDDRIYWATGEQTADLYDLSKQVYGVGYGRTKKGTYNIDIKRTPEAEPELFKTNIHENKLSYIVGKDLANKIINNKNNSDVFTGLDIKIGGEWAFNLYDEMIPQFTKEYGGKVGKTKIEVHAPAKAAGPNTFIPARKKNIEVWYMDITPKIKKKVREGQELFGVVPISIGGKREEEGP